MGATAAGTSSYFTENSQASVTVLGKTGFRVSRAGFGGYRIREDQAEHRAALELALESGCNLIDTSTNYTDGSSEKLVGNILSHLFEAGSLKREQVVVVTKVGYVQGQNLALVQDRQTEGHPFPKMVEYHPDCWHCISPEFLEDQITRSLERLKLDQIDILLLHNPEYFLKTDQNHGEYYRRIGEAFKYLEKEVARGRIQFYGISSNTFIDPKDSPEFTSLETVLELAGRIGPKNHFAVIQFPFNLFEYGAVVENNNGHKTVTELADAHKLGTLVNRPLNAYFGREIIRLADFPSHSEVSVLKAFEISLTQALHEEVLIHEAEKQGSSPWAKVLADHRDDIKGLMQWKDIVSYQLRPFISGLTDPTQNNYRTSLEQTMGAMTQLLEAKESARSHRITEALLRHCPSLKSSPSLSQKTVRLLSSFPGIHCILVGMRSLSYVRDILEISKPVSHEEAFEALNAISELIENDQLGLNVGLNTGVKS